MSKKAHFTQDLTHIYAMSKDINAHLYEFFEAIKSHDKPHSPAIQENAHSNPQHLLLWL